MTLKSSLLYAFRILFTRNREKSNGRKSLLGAMLCIAISLVPLVTVLVVSEGMINGMMSRTIGLSTGDLQVKFSARSSVIKSYEKILLVSQQLSSVDGIKASWPQIEGTALAAGKSSRTGATVRAVPEDIFTANENYASLFKTVEGEAVLSEKNSAVIGKKLSELLDLHAGDTIRLINLSYGVNNRIMPKYSSFTVKGIVSSGYQELDALWVFIPIETGFKTMNPNSARYSIAMTTEDAFSVELMKTKERLEKEVLGMGNGPEIDLGYVYSWNELNTAQYENYSSTKVLLLLIMLLIVLVASVNISSALVMLVMERKKEIAILKSLGASSSGITVSFLITGGITGLGGIMLGLPAGLLAAVNANFIISFIEKAINFFVRIFYALTSSDMSAVKSIHLFDEAYYLQNFTISIPFKELLMIAVFTLLLSLIVSAIPAVKAGKEKPIDTLRKM